jgi:acyl carrier protein
VDASEIKTTVREYIVSEFLPGEDPSAIGDSMELITQGILDSIATLKLVAFLEDRYRIALEPHEVAPEYLDTLEAIAKLVTAKAAKRK